MSYEKELRELHLMQQIYATVFSLTNKIQVQSDKCFDGLTMRQFMILLAILHLPEGEASLNRIAHKTGTTKQNVNSMVATLEKKGYVETKPSTVDRRAINVSITNVGEQAMSSGGEKSVLFLADLFAAFSVEELELLWTLLKKLYPFDGQEQSGFEEEATLKTQQPDAEKQDQLLAEFQRRRNR